MASDKVVVKSSGIGFFGLLGVLFIGLKLTGYIDWSWWLVLLPIYGPPLAACLFLLAVGCFALFIMFLAFMADLLSKK